MTLNLDQVFMGWCAILMNVFHEVPCNFCNIWIFQQPPPKILQCNHVSLIFNAMDHGGNLLDQSQIGTCKHSKKIDIYFINWMHHELMWNNMPIFSKYDLYDYGYLAFASFPMKSNCHMTHWQGASLLLILCMYSFAFAHGIQVAMTSTMCPRPRHGFLQKITKVTFCERTIICTNMFTT